MEPSQEDRQERTRKTMRLAAVAVGLWFLGSGLWGILTETPADRAVSGCEAAARAQAEPDAATPHTSSREDQTGWVVAGEVHESVENVPTVTHLWECTTDSQGRNPVISAWNPAG